MYIILYMTSDLKRGVIMDGMTPAMFADAPSAYDFIEEVFEQPNHPRFMWVRRIPYADT